MTRLVLIEEHAEIVAAIAREKALKAWKIELIEKHDPGWCDLFEHLL